MIDEGRRSRTRAKQSQAARDLARTSRNKSNRFRIALTGTPVENRVSELWALMDFLNPKVLGEEDFFRQRYRMPIERYGDMASLRDLKSRVGPFILRRLKTDKAIISDLPEKVELSEWVGLSKEQKSLYSKTVEDTLDAIARSPRGQRHGQVLALLTRLKQICNHPALALDEGAVGDGFLNRSAKLQRLEEILDEVIEAGDRALLFTQFAEWGHLLLARMQQLEGGGALSPWRNGRQSARPWWIASRKTRGPQLFLLTESRCGPQPHPSQPCVPRTAGGIPLWRTRPPTGPTGSARPTG